MKTTLLEIASVIRSKNAGPYELTLDIIFKSRKLYELALHAGTINRTLIGLLYRIPEADVYNIIAFDPANALKITLKRRMSSGSVGETDVYGAQQHAPLLGIEFDFAGP